MARRNEPPASEEAEPSSFPQYTVGPPSSPVTLSLPYQSQQPVRLGPPNYAVLGQTWLVGILDLAYGSLPLRLSLSATLTPYLSHAIPVGQRSLRLRIHSVPRGYAYLPVKHLFAVQPLRGPTIAAHTSGGLCVTQPVACLVESGWVTLVDAQRECVTYPDVGSVRLDTGAFYALEDLQGSLRLGHNASPRSIPASSIHLDLVPHAHNRLDEAPW